MSDLDTDIETLQRAVQLFAQTLKRPQQWAMITQEAGLTIDRPAAQILQTLILCQPKKLRLQELAIQLGIEPPSVTRKTQELEQNGYVERVADPQDRRATYLTITAAGREVAERLRAVQRQITTDALADWPAAERSQFVSLFERFSEDLAASSATAIKTLYRKDENA